MNPIILLVVFTLFFISALIFQDIYTLFYKIESKNTKSYSDIILSKIESDFLKDLFQFLMERKKWWLAPIILALLLLGILLIFAESSAVAPFVYPMF
jgi:hypothetical protein